MADDTKKRAPRKAAEKKTFACAACGATKAAKRLPRGWKEFDGGPTCDKCVAAGWAVRAITLPVDRIEAAVDPQTGAEVETEARLMPVVHVAWRLSTDLANWAQQRLLAAEVRRTPDMTRLPAYTPPAPNLYAAWNTDYAPAARAMWVGAAGSAQTVLRDVEERWKGVGRFDVLWRGNASACTYRYPYPYPNRADGWRPEWRSLPNGGGAVPLVSVALPGARYVLRLQRSPELARQLADFRRLASGEAHPADLRLVAVRRGGQVVGVKAVMVGRFPKTARAASDGPTARVFTSRDALLTVSIPGRKDWVLYAHHNHGPLNALRKWERRAAEGLNPPPAPTAAGVGDVAGRIADAVGRLRQALDATLADSGPLRDVRAEMARYDAWMERYRNDLKYEKRWPSAKRRRWVAKAQARIEHHRRRVDSEVKQAVAATVGYVVRQGCARVEYDDTERRLFAHWPWFGMRARFAVLAAQNNVAFSTVGRADQEAPQAGTA